MWLLILQSLYFFSPAGMANLFPPFWVKMPWLKRFDQPMDFGLTLRGRRVFGSHKTWRGLISAVIFGILTCWLQRALMPVEFFKNISLIDYSQVNIFALGGLLGLGAILGDAFKSFFKRQIGIEPGKSWFPFDQLDYILGGLLFSLIVIRLDWYYYPLILVIYFVLHLISKIIGKFLKLNDDLI